MARVERELWARYEIVNDVTYFAPEALAAYEAAGLRGYWRGYFAGRAAPLGPVGPAPVVAAFFGFAPGMVERALPSVWSLAAPDRVLAARYDGAVAALGRLAGGADVTEVVDLLERAVDQADVAGRVLGAAYAALPRPDHPYARLWQACATLREHRGDGHVAALVTSGLDGCETLVWRSAIDTPREALQPNRGWTDDEWDAAADRLRERGWLDAGGAATERARAALAEVEERTDDAAARPWRGIDTDRVLDLLDPLAAACEAVLPPVWPIALPPRQRRAE